MDISKERAEASEVFRRLPRMLNCAQSVAALCGREELSDGLAGYGGGRAPEGLCGALYAAMSLVPEARRAELRRRFAEEAGDETCSAIKNGKRTSCVDCVALATALARELGN